ncbi:MAG: hypothetical protein FWE38_02865 [Firmicutes bacterium]|nr:hypothetical protein [Bacillota bacterium]
MFVFHKSDVLPEQPRTPAAAPRVMRPSMDIPVPQNTPTGHIIEEHHQHENCPQRRVRRHRGHEERNQFIPEKAHTPTPVTPPPHNQQPSHTQPPHHQNVG